MTIVPPAPPPFIAAEAAASEDVGPEAETLSGDKACKAEEEEDDNVIAGDEANADVSRDEAFVEFGVTPFAPSAATKPSIIMLPSARSMMVPPPRAIMPCKYGDGKKNGKPHT